MFNDTDLRKSVAQHPDDAAGDTAAEPFAVILPARFGRFALFVAAAGALAFGVVGTVAYGVWFNHDQQAYVEAMAGARQALGVTALTAATPATPDEETGKKQASWSGPVTPLSPPAALQTRAADRPPPVAAASTTVARRTAPPSSPGAQRQSASGRAGQDARLAQQDRRSSTADARRKGGLFARMGSFFRRVSYRPHGTGNRQDIYSHP